MINPIITNHTENLVKVNSEISKSNKSIYTFAVNGFKFIQPCSDLRTESFFLTDSRRITLSKKDNYIEIVEIKDDGAHFYYIDLNRPIENVAYEANDYLPQPPSPKDIEEKIQYVAQRLKHITPQMGAYNEHGFAFIGEDTITRQKVFYYAKPDEEHPTQVPCSYVGPLGAESLSKFVNFKFYKEDQGYALNSYPATPIKFASKPDRNDILALVQRRQGAAGNEELNRERAYLASLFPGRKPSDF